jgi:hypothetical protein
LILDNKAFPIYFDYFINDSPNKIDVEDSIVSFIKKTKLKKNLDDDVYLKIENTFNEYITENNFLLAKDNTESSCKKSLSKKKNIPTKKFAKSQKKLLFGE